MEKDYTWSMISEFLSSYTKQIVTCVQVKTFFTKSKTLLDNLRKKKKYSERETFLSTQCDICSKNSNVPIKNVPCTSSILEEGYNIDARGLTELSTIHENSNIEEIYCCSNSNTEVKLTSIERLEKKIQCSNQKIKT